MSMPTPSVSRPSRRYLRAPRPLYFPEEAKVPESGPHKRLRKTLDDTLERWFEDRARVEADMFLYFNATDPRECCAPDIFVRMGEPHTTEIGCWKTWERGVPHLALEIISKSDRGDPPWSKKFACYEKLGVPELVRFDMERPARPLRIWDRVEEDLVERDPGGPEFHRCDALDAYWIVLPAGEHLDLRLSRDAAGTDLYRTPQELEREKDQALAQKDQALRELRAELARLHR
jgi:Uma2 family endonuclease